jgi:BirA family biotin operon repressor/biotin-[acetyl-CoA-carboxylase] ligase
MQAKPEIIRLSEVDSTNRYAMKNFDALADGTLIAAEFQTAGKGRMDRTWVSPPRENICASFVMKNIAPPVCNASIIASLGALQMLRDAAPGVKFWIKWPNDIYCGFKKIAGILCENKLSSTSSGIIAGIGININMPQSALDAIGQPATSLSVETGRAFDLQPAVTALAEALRGYYEDYSKAPGQLFNLWKQENLLIGKPVEIVDAGQKRLQGRIVDIGKSGDISFETGGKTLKFYSGDIRISKESFDEAIFQ